MKALTPATGRSALAAALLIVGAVTLISLVIATGRQVGTVAVLDAMPLEELLFLAGVGQLALAVGSLAIPRVLHWREETARLSPLTRQVFWTYAAYIWTSHVAFGLVSILLPRALLGPGPLAPCMTGFIALWWIARVLLQLLCFDRSARPAGAIYAVAETALMAAFVGCAALYSILTLRHLYP